MKKTLGWRKEPARHALASKGIKTRNKLAQSQLERIGRGGAVRNVMGRRTMYNTTLRGLALKYKDEEDLMGAVTEADYEKATRPLFDSLADADELADRGELKASVSMLNLAKAQFESMEGHFNVISDEEARQWVDAVERITAKTVATSRTQMATQLAREAQMPDQTHRTESR